MHSFRILSMEESAKNFGRSLKNLGNTPGNIRHHCHAAHPRRRELRRQRHVKLLVHGRLQERAGDIVDADETAAVLPAGREAQQESDDTDGRRPCLDITSLEHVELHRAESAPHAVAFLPLDPLHADHLLPALGRGEGNLHQAL